MGYNTDFNGLIEIDPPLSASDAQKVNAFLEKDNRDDDTLPGIWCDFWIAHYGSAIEWINGSEKTYAAEEWIRYIIDNLLPEDSIANGTIYANGAESYDLWCIDVENNVVSTRQGKVVYE